MSNERLCCVKQDWANEEARGYVYTAGSRGPLIVISTLFASVAVNSFAESLANCEGRVLNDSIKASSILATLGVVEGIVNLLMLPFYGAFADLTPYRKPALGISFAVLVGLCLAQAVVFFPQNSDRLDPNEDPADNIFLPEPIFRTDTALVILLIILAMQSTTYEFLALMTMTYIPELSTDSNEVTRYVGQGYYIFNGMQVTMAVAVILASIVFGLNDLDNVVIASGLGAGAGIFWFSKGFKRLGERREVPDGLSSKYFGLHHIFSSGYDAMTKYTQLRLLLVSWGFSAAGGSSIIALATTFLQFILGFSGATVSGILSLALVMTVPGAAIASKVVDKMGLKAAYFWLNIVFSGSFIVAPLVLKADQVDAAVDGNNATLTRFGNCNSTTLSEEGLELLNGTNVESSTFVLILTLMFCSLWGALLGGSLVMVNSFFAALIPAGSESAYFGIKATFAKSVTFIPPLIFTAVNESSDGVSQFAIMAVAPFFLLGAVVAYFIDFEKGLQEIEGTLHLRRKTEVKKISVLTLPSEESQSAKGSRIGDDEDQALAAATLFGSETKETEETEETASEHDNTDSSDDEDAPDMEIDQAAQSLAGGEDVVVTVGLSPLPLTETHEEVESSTLETTKAPSESL